jgi:hypothetical protein
MFKVAVIIWIMLGTVLAGSLVVVVVSVPELYDQGMRMIPAAGILGYVVAIPFSFLIARKIMGSLAQRA